MLPIAVCSSYLSRFVQKEIVFPSSSVTLIEILSSLPRTSEIGKSFSMMDEPALVRMSRVRLIAERISFARLIMSFVGFSPLPGSRDLVMSITVSSVLPESVSMPFSSVLSFMLSRVSARLCSVLSLTPL